MINSISNMSSSMLMMPSSGMKGPPPPRDQDVFQVADTNADGVVSLSELEVLTAGIEEVTGTTINADEALSSFDANQDGGLSGEELLLMMTSNGLAPPNMTGGEGTDFGMKPPPPPRGQAVSAYEQSSNYDQIAQLIELLQSKYSDEEYVPINVMS
ncbi:MAG: hypothetical protein V1706_03285 [Pseudomonadota bacterium]